MPQAYLHGYSHGNIYWTILETQPSSAVCAQSHPLDFNGSTNTAPCPPQADFQNKGRPLRFIKTSARHTGSSFHIHSSYRLQDAQKKYSSRFWTPRDTQKGTFCPALNTREGLFEEALWRFQTLPYIWKNNWGRQNIPYWNSAEQPQIPVYRKGTSMYLWKCPWAHGLEQIFWLH